MRAMALHETRPVEENALSDQEMPTPEPRQDEILIRVTACGVCHTDLHMVEGDLPLPALPIVPGHQVVGTVVTAIKNGRYKTGDRVGVTWFQSSCGACDFCLAGCENLCAHARFTGFHVNGGYAEFMATRESSAFPVPDVFSDQAAVPLLCGGVIGYRALRFAQVRPGERLGLFGFGNSAHVVLQIAAKRGVKPYVFTRGKRHRELAADLGAVWVGGPDDAPPADTHASIIFAPAGDLVPKALARLERGGRLVLAGITMSQIPAMDYSLVYQERSIMSVANTTRRDAMELLDASAAVPIEPVVESFPLDQANQVLTMMKTGYLKAGACLVP